MADVERCIVDERERWRALVTDDDGTPAAWEDLVRRTEPLVPPSRPFYPCWEAYSAFNPATMPGYYGLDGQLAEEWRAYIPKWEAFLIRNPRSQIADMMAEISEANDASSWPYGWEDDIRAWVRAGFPDDLGIPWDDRIKQPAWRDKLADAAERAGDGWVYNEDGAYKWR